MARNAACESLGPATRAGALGVRLAGGPRRRKKIRSLPCKRWQVFQDLVGGAEQNGVRDRPIAIYVKLEKRRINIQTQGGLCESAKPVDRLGEYEPAKSRAVHTRHSANFRADVKPCKPACRPANNRIVRQRRRGSIWLNRSSRWAGASRGFLGLPRLSVQVVRLQVLRDLHLFPLGDVAAAEEYRLLGDDVAPVPQE